MNKTTHYKKFIPLEATTDEFKKMIFDICDPVMSTLGVGGKTVIMEKFMRTGVPAVTKDGVSIAKQLRFTDPLKDTLAKIIVQSSREVAERVGDGTTTACTLIAYMLISADFDRYDRTFFKEMKRVIDRVINLVDKYRVNIESIEQSEDLLRSIAFVSSNGDNELVDVVIDAYKKIGVNGKVIFTQTDSSTEIRSKISEGALINAEYMVKKQKAREVLTDAKVLLLHGFLKRKSDMSRILRQLAQDKQEDGKPTPYLILMKNCDESFKKLIADNNDKGVLDVTLQMYDGGGELATQILRDLEILTDSKLCDIDGILGPSPGAIEFNILQQSGKVPSIILDPDSSVIQYELDEEKKKLANARVNDIRKQIEETKADFTIEQDIRDMIVYDLETRLAKFGKTAEIFCGAHTKSGRDERFDRLEDTICAIDSSVKTGVVPGGGYIFMEFLSKYKPKGTLGEQAVISALEKFCLRLFNNAGFKDVQYKPKKVFNLRNAKFEPISKNSVLDPAQVISLALNNAYELVKSILNTDYVGVLDFTSDDQV